LIVVSALAFAASAFAAEEPLLEVGIAVRNITPDTPIWLAGYAARKHPSEKVDSPLVAQAFALKSSSGERLVLVSLDNCEVSHAFVDPIVKEVEQKHQLKRGAVIFVSSHTHSAPVLEQTLISMFALKDLNIRSTAKHSGPG
jgi:hypothetical protein